jgi:hypothetical protein
MPCEGRNECPKLWWVRRRIECPEGINPETGSREGPGSNKANIVGKGLDGKASGVK